MGAGAFEQSEKWWIMKCSCPKCSAPLSDDLSRIPEKGKNEKCPECGGSYWIHRESFILRAYAINGERCCSHCGETLGQSTYCPGCGTLYPDYCVVQNKKPAQRAFEKKEFSFGLSLPRVTRKAAKSYSKQELESISVSGVSRDLRRQLLMVGAAIALFAVLAGVALFYMRGRAEEKFVSRFVVVLYAIKSGTDHSLKMSALLASGSGLADKDLVLLKSVHAENAAALQLLSPPPEKFSDAYNRLLTLSGTYKKIYDLCLSSAPPATVAASAGALESQFYVQAKALKLSLPPSLREELTAKSTRYNNLQFMLE